MARKPRSRSLLKPEDTLPDVRDGLSRVDRVILSELERAQAESGDHPISSALLYGRVVQHVSLSVPEFQRALERLVRRRHSLPE